MLSCLKTYLGCYKKPNYQSIGDFDQNKLPTKSNPKQDISAEGPSELFEPRPSQKSESKYFQGKNVIPEHKSTESKFELGDEHDNNIGWSNNAVKGSNGVFSVSHNNSLTEINLDNTIKSQPSKLEEIKLFHNEKITITSRIIDFLKHMYSSEDKKVISFLSKDPVLGPKKITEERFNTYIKVEHEEILYFLSVTLSSADRGELRKENDAFLKLIQGLKLNQCSSVERDFYQRSMLYMIRRTGGKPGKELFAPGSYILDIILDHFDYIDDEYAKNSILHLIELNYFGVEIQTDKANELFARFSQFPDYPLKWQQEAVYFIFSANNVSHESKKVLFSKIGTINEGQYNRILKVYNERKFLADDELIEILKSKIGPLAHDSVIYDFLKDSHGQNSNKTQLDRI